MHYIYKIRNDINGKLYIGKTGQTVQSRFQEHIYTSKLTYTNRPLYDAMNKYGIEHFQVETIDYCKNDKEASEREIYWIAYYDTYRNGYNATIGGDGVSYLDLNEEEMIERYMELKSMRAVAREYDIAEKTVRNIVNKYEIPKFTKKEQFNIEITNEEIMEKYRELQSTRKVAKLFKISKSTVCRAIHKCQTKYA